MEKAAGNPSVRHRGVVINFLPRKGFGFIRGEDDEKIFVHYSDIRSEEFRTLIAGEEVEYSIRIGVKGPQAVEVVRLNPPPDDDPVDPSADGRTW